MTPGHGNLTGIDSTGTSLKSAMQSPNAEEVPLLGFKQRDWRGRARQFFSQDIRVQNAYLPLLVCCFITGLIDAGSYNAWKVFISMQTGGSPHTREYHSIDNKSQATPSFSP